jgi:hypothetical protein
MVSTRTVRQYCIVPSTHPPVSTMRNGSQAQVGVLDLFHYHASPAPCRVLLNTITPLKCSLGRTSQPPDALKRSFVRQDGCKVPLESPRARWPSSFVRCTMSFRGIRRSLHMKARNDGRKVPRHRHYQFQASMHEKAAPSSTRTS